METKTKKSVQFRGSFFCCLKTKNMKGNVFEMKSERFEIRAGENLRKENKARTY